MLYQRTIIEWQFWLSKRIIFSLFAPNNFYTDSITHTVYTLKQKIIIDFKMLYKIHTHIYYLYFQTVCIHLHEKNWYTKKIRMNKYNHLSNTCKGRQGFKHSLNSWKK